MCRIGTGCSGSKHVTSGSGVLLALIALAGAAPGVLRAQQPPLRNDGTRFDWRRIGNTSIDLALPSTASGSVLQAAYSSDGSALFVRTASGTVFETRDFETWKPSGPRFPAKAARALSGNLPEAGASADRASATRSYAMGRFIYRSDDGGATWTNVTGYRNQSILGEGMTDMAVSPRDPDEITVTNQYGVWRTLDGGATWSGLNQGLPNFPGARIFAVPGGLRSARVGVDVNGPAPFDVEWSPGERLAWRPTADNRSSAESALREMIGRQLGITITSIGAAADWLYAGTADGRLFASNDRGVSWQPGNALPDAGAVLAIFVSPREPRIAIASFAIKSLESRAVRVARTSNGGRTWDDTSSNLPLRSVTGVTADVASGSIYAATADGVYFTSNDLANMTFAAAWQRVSGGLPDGPVLDVRLDDAANQLFVLVGGQGLFGTLAPHRMRDWQIVNAADFSSRPAAPGTLLSILGARLDRVRAGAVTVPLLSANDTETQIQVPFEVTGSTLALTLENGSNSRPVGFPLASVSPAIFVDKDGTPLLLDADSGTALDTATPARSGMRLQILATGLGAVDPAWPTGVAAPADNTPKVVAPVSVLLDRQPVEVLRATLAPGYIGFYVIEVQLPQIVNAGAAELFIQSGDRQSNRVRVYLSPTTAVSH